MKALLGLLMLATPLQAATIAITGGRVATGTAAPVEGATVLIRDGRIVAVGAVTVPAGATVIDATNKWVTPGLIAAMSRIGLGEVEAVGPTNDAGASKSPFSAALDVVPGLNAAATPVAINRIGGITRAAVAPEATRDIFGGNGALISLAAGTDLLMRGRVFQLVELGEDGARIAGGSRPAAYASLLNALDEAREVAAGRARFAAGGDREAIITRADATALVPIIDGRQALVVHVERASDIVNVLRLRERFPKLRLILLGAREGWLVADKIAAARVPVIALSLEDRPEQFEALAATRNNIGRLVAAGVVVAIGSYGDGTGNQTRNLPQFAGNAVAQGRVPGGVGLSWTQALGSITAAPAEIWGMTDAGTLSVGKRADVVVWDGDPLELSSTPVAVLIDGVPQSMTSRQTELRDRYLSLSHDAAPLQYRR